jgi:hypothetical protein
MKKHRKQNKGSMKAGYAALSDDELRQRWLATRPRAFRMLAVTSGLTIGAFLFNRAVPLPQKSHDYLTIGFQICSVFAVCSLLMFAMSLVYGRTAKATA